MNSADRERVKELLSRAARLPLDDRAAFIRQAASADPRVAAEALDLLHTLDDSAFMSAPTGAGMTATLGTSEPLAESPGARIGRYKLLQLIGEGGFGAVFMAEQTEPVNRRVALKIIKAGMDTKQVIARFEAERQALAMMDHPNIARVLDAGATESGRPYFVMELVRGEPVTGYCDRERLAIRQRLELFRDICQAVQHAHQKGIIHRDLKPSNILVTVADGQPLPKVIDFGIAKATAGRLTDKTLFTEMHQLIGTPQYMSPEQAEASGVDIDTRSDVYALGVVLYELLAGSTPLDGGRLRSMPFADIQRVIREEDAPRPSTRLSSLREGTKGPRDPGIQGGDSGAATWSSASSPRSLDSSDPRSLFDVAARRHSEPAALVRQLRGDLDWIVMKCLEKDRRRRYATAVALAEDVGRYLDHEPVLATPPSTSYRFQKFVRRNRGWVLAGSVIAATLIAATGISIAFALRASRALAAEEDQRKLAQKNAEETRQVAEFQQAQLSGIDAQTMGMRLRSDLLEKARAAAGRSALSPQEVDARVAELEQLIAGSDFTGMAMKALDDNFFQPALTAIEQQFADQPLVKARLLQTLAITLQKLGLMDAATGPQEEALAIYRGLLGEANPQTLITIGNVGQLLLEQGKPAEAEPYLRDAAEKLRRTLGDEHSETLIAINNQGHLLRVQGDLPGAERCFREAMAASRRVLGDDDPQTLSTIANLGMVIQEAGRLSEAEPYFREALDTRRRVQGEEHPQTLASINNMGTLWWAQGRLEDAERLVRESLEKHRRVLGDDHPNTLGAITNMGLVLRAQGRLAETETYYREALEKRRLILGNEHPDTLTTINNTGFLLQTQGKLEEAEVLLRESMEKHRQLLGDDNPDTLTAIGNLGLVLLIRGNWAEAEPLCREALEGRRRVRGDHHPDTLISIINMGNWFEAVGNPAEAIALLVPAEPAIRESFTGGNVVRVGRFLTVLGRARAAAGEFDAAEKNLAEAHALLSEAKNATPLQRQEMFSGMVTLYEAWHAAEPDQGHDDQAVGWRTKLDEWRASTQPAVP